MASIDKRNGRWRARWRTPAGESRSATFNRKVDAERHLVAMEHGKLSGSYVDPSAGRITVADFWCQWAERQAWRDSSRRQADSHYRTHIEPALGRRPLNSLRRGDIEAWAARLPIAPRTAGQVVRYVSSMFEAAVADGLVSANPVNGAKRPKVEAQPVVPYTGEEVDALRATAPGWFAVALDLGEGAGLRQSEASGLTVDRVNFLRRELVVDRQLRSLPAGATDFGPPKTSRSYRTVPLADVVVEALSRHIAEHGTGEHGLLLHRPDGDPVHHHRFDQEWRRIRRRAAAAASEKGAAAAARLAAAKFHGARHTYASTLLSGGVSVAAAAEYLGHTPGELLRTYAHLMPADHDRARSVVQAAFSSRPRVQAVSRTGAEVASEVS